MAHMDNRGCMQVHARHLAAADRAPRRALNMSPASVTESPPVSRSPSPTLPAEQEIVPTPTSHDDLNEEAIKVRALNRNAALQGAHIHSASASRGG